MTLLAFGTERGQIAAGLINPVLFEPPYNDIAKRAIEYRQRYKKAPGIEHIDDLFDHILLDPKNKEAQLYNRILVALCKQAEGLNEIYTLDRINEFVRRQTYKAAIYKAAARYQQGGDGVADDVESILNEVYRFRAANTSPGLFMNEARALAFFDPKNREHVRIGIDHFDRYEICPTRGEEFIFMAPRGRGKSWFATHIETMALLQHWRVCDISLEMDEEVKAQRVFQNMLAMAKRAEPQTLTRLVLDDSGLVNDFEYVTETPTLAINQGKQAEDIVKAFQKERSALLSRLNVKSFPSGSLDMRGLRAHLDFLEQVNHFVPDMLVVDYPFLMKLNANDLRASLGRLFVDLRGLGKERNMAVVALHQTNRKGEDAINITSGHASEDISIFGTADIVMSYNATQTERKRGVARLNANKVRNDKDNITVCITQDYTTGQFVTSSAPTTSDYWKRFNAFSGVSGEPEDTED